MRVGCVKVGKRGERVLLRVVFDVGVVSGHLGGVVTDDVLNDGR